MKEMQRNKFNFRLNLVHFDVVNISIPIAIPIAKNSPKKLEFYFSYRG